MKRARVTMLSIWNDIKKGVHDALDSPVLWVIVALYVGFKLGLWLGRME